MLAEPRIDQKHVYNSGLIIMFLMYTDQSIWFSPNVRGTRPPPCRNFTFICINKRQALLYGGYLPEGKLRVSDLYLFDFSDWESMVSYCDGLKVVI